MKTQVRKVPLEKMIEVLEKLKSRGHTHFNIDVTKTEQGDVVDIYAYIKEGDKKPERKIYTAEYLRSLVTYG